MTLRIIVVLGLMLAGCGDDAAPAMDSGTPDSGRDGGPPPVDAPRPDTGPRPMDAGMEIVCTPVEVVAGHLHSCVRCMENTTFCWGRNHDGELGDNRMRHAEDCGDGFDSRDCSSLPVPTLGIDDAVEISARGGPSTCVRNAAGAVECWGLEWADNPGFGGPIKHFEPFLAMIPDAIDLGNGFRHMCAVRMDGTVMCQGTNGSGQVGDGTRMMDRLTPVAVMDLTGVLDVEVAAGGATSCARKADEVWCWGANDSKQLGDGDIVHEMCSSGVTPYDCSSRPVQVDGLTAVTQISVGGTHVCAVRPDGTVACWGTNYYGQLGDGTLVDARVPVDVVGITDAVEVSAGYDHTCIRRTGGEVVCFGSNDRGRLGDGDDSHGTCTFGADVVDCSTAPVPVMGLDDAVDVSVGLSHACALRDSGQVVCWGTNTYRQLGDGSRDDSNVPIVVMGLE